MKRIIVRDATSEDDASIAKIHVHGWRKTYRNHVPDSYLDSLSVAEKTESWKKQIEDAKENEHIFVAEMDDRIVGWCTAGKSEDEDASFETGEIKGMYVDPEMLGKGVGTALMEHALEVLKNDGYKKVTLWVLIANEDARRFYEKKGWTADGKTAVKKRDDFDLHVTRYTLSL